MIDLSFTDNTEGVTVAVPLKITGTCAGRQALAQRVMTMLLRNVDDVARPNSTGVLGEVGASNVGEQEQLRNTFNLAAKEVRDVIQADQGTQTDLAADEILEDIAVGDVVLATDVVHVTFDITTQEGETLRAELDL